VAFGVINFSRAKPKIDMKLLLELSFLGTAYCGFQVQKNGKSIQSTVQGAVEKIYGTVRLTGCSRTDSGVHARSFYCTVEAEDVGKIPPARVPLALNSLLPEDVAVKSARFVDDSFHPRYSAKGKQYRYFVLNSRIRDPFLEGRAFRYPIPLDAECLNRLAAELAGRHDFSAFMAAGSDVSDTVRTVTQSHVEKDGELITFIFAADGFLYNMVRIMVGTLIDFSLGRLADKSISDIIASRDRSRAGFTAPPEGLYLWEVYY